MSAEHRRVAARLRADAKVAERESERYRDLAGRASVSAADHASQAADYERDSIEPSAAAAALDPPA